MNIFVLDQNPYKAAEMMCDKHINKMLVESAQMLSTAIFLKFFSEPNEENKEKFSKTGFNKPTHINHPCNVWVRTSRQNFEWLLQHEEGLFQQYKLRYGKSSHKSYDKICMMRDFAQLFPDIGMTKFALAMPEHTKRQNAVESYREYYKTKAFAKWQKGIPSPDWW
jgi:hypothetical protein